MPLHQVRLLRRMHADRHVSLTHGQIQVAVVEQQRHRDVRILLQEVAQPRCQPRRAEADRRRHLEPSGRLLLALRQQRLGHRQFGEHLAHRPVQALALLGQDQPARMPVEQRHLQVLLQRRDLARHGGLAQVQRVTGMGEASGFRDRVEHPKLIPIHPVPDLACLARDSPPATMSTLASKPGLGTRLFRRANRRPPSPGSAASPPTRRTARPD